jgi:hypothetical protein
MEEDARNLTLFVSAAAMLEYQTVNGSYYGDECWIGTAYAGKIEGLKCGYLRSLQY